MGGPDARLGLSIVSSHAPNGDSRDASWARCGDGTVARSSSTWPSSCSVGREREVRTPSADVGVVALALGDEGRGEFRSAAAAPVAWLSAGAGGGDSIAWGW